MSGKDETVVIVSAARTPMGGFQGALADVSAPELGAVAIRDAVAVDEVFMGCVLPAAWRA